MTSSPSLFNRMVHLVGPPRSRDVAFRRCMISGRLAARQAAMRRHRRESRGLVTRRTLLVSWRSDGPPRGPGMRFPTDRNRLQFVVSLPAAVLLHPDSFPPTVSGSLISHRAHGPRRPRPTVLVQLNVSQYAVWSYDAADEAARRDDRRAPRDGRRWSRGDVVVARPSVNFYRPPETPSWLRVTARTSTARSQISPWSN